MKRIATLLLIFGAFSAFAEWEACPTTCKPPTGTVSGLSPLPLYAVPVGFGEEVKSGGVPAWTWIKTANFACTPAQLADDSDKVACAAKIGAVLMLTPRVKMATVRASALMFVDSGEPTEMNDLGAPEAPNDGTSSTMPEHCPLRLPDSAYTAEQREQCAAYDAAIGLETGPRVRWAKN